MFLLNLRMMVRWRLRALFRRGGDFSQGEASDRAARVDATWARYWPDIAPRPGVHLTPPHSDRWVRFHSLPGSKRYPDTDRDLQEVITRHFAVLDALVGDRAGVDLTVVGVDYGPMDLFGGWTKKHLPGAWPWKKWSPSNDPEAGPYYFWVSGATAVRDLGPLLKLVAEEKATIRICDADDAWMYVPYDGGADVFARSVDERDALRQEFAGWLPSRADGV